MDNIQINTADEAREYAIEWQRENADKNISYGELAQKQAEFNELVKQYPELKEEFIENAII